MIILLGPDASGKTHLKAQLMAEGMDSMHFTKDTDYDTYMALLSGQKSRPIPLGEIPFIPSLLLQKDAHWVLDRWFYCEGPYTEVIRKEPIRWSLKQFHNLHLATIAHNPVVILMTRKPDVWPEGQPIREDQFLPVLESYRKWLDMLEVTYISWDWQRPPMTVEALATHSLERQQEVIWWRNMAKRGIAGYGNTIYPTALILAEILGGYNVYHYPFEQGPSGYYLSELIDEAGVPLSSFYLTNWKKTVDSEENEVLLRRELLKTGASHVVFLGREAEKAKPIVLSTGLPEENTHYLRHPGWVVNHSESIKEEKFRKMKYSKDWREIWQKILGERDLQDSDTSSPEEDELVVVPD